MLLLELALEKKSDQYLSAYRPGGGGWQSRGRGFQGPRPGQSWTDLDNARFMSSVQELFWCDARDEQGCLLHAPDCDQQNCFVVQGKKQETNTGSKAKLLDHNRTQSPVRSVVRGGTTRTRATTSNAFPRSSRARTAVARAVARATPTRKVARAGPRAVTKAKRGVKVDEEALTARSRTGKCTSAEGTPILHQGGTLSPLVGSHTPHLRLVPRRKPNKKKGLSVPTKMGTSQTPANVPVSCAWGGNCRRRRLEVTCPAEF